MGNAPTKPSDQKKNDGGDKSKPEAPTPMRFGKKKFRGPSSIQKLPQGNEWPVILISSVPHQQVSIEVDEAE